MLCMYNNKLLVLCYISPLFKCLCSVVTDSDTIRSISTSTLCALRHLTNMLMATVSSDLTDLICPFLLKLCLVWRRPRRSSRVMHSGSSMLGMNCEPPGNVQTSKRVPLHTTRNYPVQSSPLSTILLTLATDIRHSSTKIWLHLQRAHHLKTHNQSVWSGVRCIFRTKADVIMSADITGCYVVCM